MHQHEAGYSIILTLWHCDIMEGGGRLKLNVTMMLSFP